MNPVFWSRVAWSSDVDSCWPWKLGLDAHGYGQWTVGQKKIKPHRYSYEETFGPIPEGLVVRHRCDNKPC